MRARAQKKKKVSGEAEETPQPRAVGPAAGVAARRALPDPQGPPVVAPVLMPAVVLADREGETDAAAAAVEAEGVAETPDTESGATAPRRSSAQESAAQPSVQQREAQPPAAPSRHEDRAGDVDGGEAAAWRASDEARLLVQSPRRLFLYWRFARDPRELLREALGPVAERLGPAVRLVDVASGEEGETAPAAGSDYWFDVLPGRLLRAEVGFHGEGLPFVRLISSNTVETPAVGVSPVGDEAPEFRVPEQEFGRVLEATGFTAEEPRGHPALLDAPTQTDEPLRARAGSDTARPTSSPRDGDHFSNTHGGELF